MADPTVSAEEREPGSPASSAAPARPPKPPEAAQRLPRGLRLRLIVAIPLIVTFLVMLSGFLALWIGYPLFFRPVGHVPAAAVERRLVLAFVAVGAFALVSLGVSIALARSIARPLRELASRVRSLGGASDEESRRSGEATEIGALGSALERAADSVSSLRLDSYTLRSLEGAVVTITPEGTISSFNPVAESILGLGAADVVGRHFRHAIPDEPANEPFLAGIDGALERSEGASSDEATIRTGDGRTVHLGYSISLLHDEDGNSLGIVLTCKDLAEHKAAEQLLRRKDNIRLVCAMATNVAHEVRNPLGAISGLVETSRDASPPDSPVRRYTAKILEYIERINRICQELLTVGRPERRSVEPVDINELARSTLELIRYDDANKDIDVRETYAPELPAISGDAERLGQVLLNILRNAFQAIRAVDGRGHIELSTRPADDGIVIAVMNTGPSIPHEQLKDLFVRFYTTKRRGTGLGLAISKQLVAAHGGDIHVESSPEHGTTFTVTLPSAGRPPEQEG